MIHPFYTSNNLRIHEIEVGKKYPEIPGWPSANRDHGMVAKRLEEPGFNKYGWALDENHVVVDIDVHDPNENGFESLARLENAIGFKLEDACAAIVDTPSGGRHYYFTKPKASAFGKVFKQHYPGIDFINGKGKQVVAAGSAHDQHDGTYDFRADEPVMLEIPCELVSHLQSLRDERPASEPQTEPDQRSGDEFNKSPRGLQLLIGELRGRGYEVRQKSGYYEFDRPGKTTDSKCSGHAGKLSKNGNYQLVCFSLSDAVFPSNESMTIFNAYALLCFSGDHASAASALFDRGFAAQDDGDVDLSKLLNNSSPSNDFDDEADELNKDPGPFPPECMKPEGTLSQIIEYTLARSMYPQPVLALAGAFALLATITGRKIAGQGNLRTNCYIIALATSGEGKNRARLTNKELLPAAGMSNMLAPEDFASAAGIASQLEHEPCSLFQIDEIQDTLRTMNDSRSNPHLFLIAKRLKDLYSSSDSIWKGPAYADRKRNIELDQPHCVVYGAGIPEATWEAIGANSVSDGFMGRMMVFEGDRKVKPVEVDESVWEYGPKATLIEDMEFWRDLNPGGNLNGSTSVQLLRANYGIAAKERLAYHREACKGRDESESRTALWARANEKASKIALLVAISRQARRKNITVSLDDVDYGIRLINWMTRKILWRSGDHVARTAHEEKVIRLLKIADGNSLHRIGRLARWLPANERRSILNDLVANGSLEKVTVTTKGRPKNIYRRRRT